MATLDAALQSLLLEHDFFEKNPSSGKFSRTEQEQLAVSIEFSGDIAPLEAAGFITHSVIGKIASGLITMQVLKQLVGIPQVQRIESQMVGHPHLNYSVPEIKADKVWTRSGDNFSGYTGKGVIIGIIDTGIDFNHHTFKRPDGTSRIWKIWDQTINAPVNPPATGETAPPAINNPTIFASPVPLGYGVEYTWNQINDTITYLQDTAHNTKPAVVVRHTDQGSHGSHVAGIAGGNGSQSGDCHGQYHYIGVAPEAMFIVVRLWGLTYGDKGQKLTPPSKPPLGAPSANLVRDALCYIINEAKNGTPNSALPELTFPAAVSINMSFGKFTDIMDGSSLVCLDIDTILTSNSVGTAIVISAGNDAAEQYKARLNVPAGPTATVSIPFEVQNDTDTRYLAIRYTGTNLQARLISPAATAVNTIPWTANGAANQSATANGTGAGSLVTLSNKIPTSPNNIVISIKPPTTGKNLPGTWTIELKDSGSAVTPVDAFCLYGNWRDSGSLKFTDKNQYTSTSTLSEYATSMECITVGNYEGPGIIFSHGGLAETSSRGPALGAARPLPKPELCAPGEDIKSAGIAADRCSCCCTCCQSYYVSKGGTSMAAPHVAGAIALMFHKNPTLTHTSIRQWLTAKAAPKDSGSSADEDPGWGVGKLDAKESVAILPQINPPVIAPFVAVPHDPVTSLQEQLIATSNGRQLNGLFNRYFPEIMDLINKNKRVATQWHRCKGPVWTRLALRAAYSPDMKMPAADEALPLQEAAKKFLLVLKQYASDAFRRDIIPYEPLLASVSEGMTVSEMISSIGNRPIEPSGIIQRSFTGSFETERRQY